MSNNARLPQRLAGNRHVSPLLAEDLPHMQSIVEHNRGKADPAESSPVRRLRGRVEVQLWIESDGSESIAVCGGDLTHLELKGLLHDGVYALAHQGEPGFTVPSS